MQNICSPTAISISFSSSIPIIPLQLPFSYLCPQPASGGLLSSHVKLSDFWRYSITWRIILPFNSTEFSSKSMNGFHCSPDKTRCLLHKLHFLCLYSSSSFDRFLSPSRGGLSARGPTDSLKY